ncbi:MAG: DUF1292 domain-containing protein [Lachnospiraceae bacterium]|nr:DUF1292 domain-containing protein [Lachnospiraceae bacterium]
MSNEATYITFETDDGEEVRFEVVETTTIAGREYLMITEPDEEDEVPSMAYIMRKISDEGEDAFYEIVDDETELDSVFKVFEQLLEDEVDFID